MSSQLRAGTAHDLTPGDYDAPPFSLGGPTDYAFSPDSKELAYASNHDKVEATSTNGDIWVVAINGGSGGPAKNITEANHGYDGSPQFSPDGRFIAYRSQETPGFEADRFRLMLYNRQTGKAQSISESLDSSIDEFTFTPNSQSIYLCAEDHGRSPIYSVAIAGGPVKKVIAEGGAHGDIHLTADGKTLVFSHSSMTKPSEIFRADANGSGSVTALTTTNTAFISPFNLRPAEDVTWTGAAGAQVGGWLIQTAQLPTQQKIPPGGVDSWWTTGRLER